ncbi:MAG: phosphoadenosine phosphosulfate reductase family protein [Ardenticatenaceae bacterium]|nr:phosphoadenosine phosphosulfate reductase family protein [Ardenticatenaceae bacterium]
MRMQSFFEDERLTLSASIDLTAQSLVTYGQNYHHWAAAYSGGKDSSAMVTLLVHLIKTGAVPKPESLTVLYADTRMELPPLYIAAMALLEELERRGVKIKVVRPKLDNRFFVYMFGRGVPPPHNHFRWCTPRLKVNSMMEALAGLREEYDEKFLMLTGVRIGESVARDQRIALSCSSDSGECGQGWFQQTTPSEIADTLAPLLHWRVCHIGDWLMFEAPRLEFPTRAIVEAYGYDVTEEEQIEISTRTGCVGCNLVEEDKALENVLRMPQWAYLAPLRRLRPLYRELQKPQNRLRKHEERNQDGSLAARQGRLGPLTMEARRYGLAAVAEIQEEINAVAREQGRPETTLIDAEELARIEELIAANTWPDGWEGDEPRGDVLLPRIFADGVTQPLLLQNPL